MFEVEEIEIEDTPTLDTTFHDIEMNTGDTNFADWLRKAEKIGGLKSLDGDEYEGADGYSLDGAFEAFRAGVTPAKYIAGIPLRRSERLALGYEEYVKTDIFKGIVAE